MRKQIILVASLLAMSTPAVFGQAKDALYKSLGGKEILSLAVVDLFVGNVAAGLEDQRSFFKADVADPTEACEVQEEPR